MSAVDRADYSCVLRVEADGLDIDALEASLSLKGECVLVGRPAQRTTYWEFPPDAERSNGADLAGAIATVARSFAPEAAQTISSLRAHWWCGAFHASMVCTARLSASMIAMLDAFGAPLSLSTYYSPEEECEAFPDDEPFFNEYRFWLAGPDAAVCEVRERAGDVKPWRRFTEGLDDALTRWTEAWPGMEVVPTHVVFEQVQHGFDGGARFSSDDFRRLRNLGVEVVVIWKRWPDRSATQGGYSPSIEAFNATRV